MGRPTKFTPQIQQSICDLLRAGNTRKTAAEVNGIEYQTFLNWFQVGMQAKQGAFFEFFECVTRAESEAESGYVGVIEKAAFGHEAITTKRTIKPVHKLIKRKLPDGTVIEEPIVLEEITEETILTQIYDWRAALEWLKRRKRSDWGDSLDLRKLSDEQIIALLNREAETGSSEAED